MELREGLEKLAGMSESIARRLLGKRLHSSNRADIAGSLLGAGIGAGVGRYAGGMHYTGKIKSFDHIGKAFGMAIGLGIGSPAGGLSARAAADIANHIKIKRLAKKLRIGAGVGAAGAVGAGGLAAYKKGKADAK